MEEADRGSGEQVPPFLAYYGVATSDRSSLETAYQQIKLYRSYLRSSSGAWKHIVLGSGTDAGLWNTGNGWAAHGSLRVLATLKNSQWGSTFDVEIADLTAWVQEILRAAFQKIKVCFELSGILRRVFPENITS